MTIQLIIDRLRKLHAASTRGPWKLEESSLHEGPIVATAGKSHPGTFVCELNTAEDGSAKRDGKFIAAAHNHLPEVLAELERLREVAIETLDKILEDGK